MFDLETFRILKDTLKNVIYENALGNIVHFKKIIEILSTSTKEGEKIKKVFDVENLKNAGKSKTLENIVKSKKKWNKENVTNTRQYQFIPPDKNTILKNLNYRFLVIFYVVFIEDRLKFSSPCTTPARN